MNKLEQKLKQYVRKKTFFKKIKNKVEERKMDKLRYRKCTAYRINAKRKSRYDPFCIGNQDKKKYYFDNQAIEIKELKSWCTNCPFRIKYYK